MSVVPSTWIPLFKHFDNSILYKIPSDELNLIQTWSGNRYLDLDHVQAIKFLTRDVQELDGPYTVARIIKDSGEISFELIDGQHRRHARRQNERKEGGGVVITNNPVIVRLYHCESESKAIELFEKINNSKPMKYQHSAESKIYKCIELLKLAFPQMIRSGKTFRPFIREEELRRGLKESYIFRDGNYQGPTPDDLVREIVLINQSMHEKVTDNISFSNLPISIQQKALEKKFYLGLELYTFPWLKLANQSYEFKLNPLGL